MKALERIKWNLHRWRRMKHPAEDIYRLKQVLHDKLLDRFLKVPSGFALRLKQIDFTNTNFHSYTANIAGEYNLLNIKIPLTYTAWRTEPKNKKQTPEQYKGSLNYRDYNVAGENKYLYELNRLHVLPVLAYSFVTTQNSAEFKTLENIITSWKNENPFLHSLNWKSGIEAAIRAFNLIIARLLLKDVSDKNVQQLCAAIDAMIAGHYYFLKGHLSLYSSANNHLLKELFGLTVIAAVYDYNHSQDDLTKYFNFYQDELLKQTYADGGSKEQSVHYHAAVLNCSLLVLLFAIKAGLKPNEKFIQRLQNMCVFLDEITLGGKRESLFGDKDDSNILYDVFNENFNLYTSLLATGKSIFGIEYNNFKQQQSIDFINAVLYENIFFKTNEKPVLSSQSIVFKEAGYFIFKAEETKSNLFFDIGEMGLEPLAAHGHSDSLHFTLWVKGKPFIVDPGVYQYNKIFTRWRDYFKGAQAHNTISINNKNHATSRGVMMWSDLPEVKLCGYDITSQAAECEAQVIIKHKNIIVQHTRKILMQHDGYLIRDTLRADKNFMFIFSLHFHPSIKIHIEGNAIKAVGNDAQLIVENEFFNKAEKYFGKEDGKIIGWYSSKYDVKEPSPTIQFSNEVSKHIEFETSIKIIR